MQASDRAVGFCRDDGFVQAEDDRNKAVFVAERLTFAYTGNAEIGGDTAEFFAQQVSGSLGAGRSVENAIADVGDMCAQYFAQLRPDADRHHAFVGVGWTDEAVVSRRPFLTWTSNALSSNREWTAEAATEFSTEVRALKAGDPYEMHFAGVELSPAAQQRIHAQVGSSLAVDDDLAPVAELLTAFIRGIDNAAVGDGVMVNCLPIAPGPPDGNIHLIGGPPERDTRTFTYVPAGTTRTEYLGPLIVTSGGMRMGDFRATGGQPGSFGITYRPPGSPPRPSAAIGQRVREYRFGRNDPCWCGSGRKYKRCHGR